MVNVSSIFSFDIETGTVNREVIDKRRTIPYSNIFFKISVETLSSLEAELYEIFKHNYKRYKHNIEIKFLSEEDDVIFGYMENVLRTPFIARHISSSDSYDFYKVYLLEHSNDSYDYESAINKLIENGIWDY